MSIYGCYNKPRPTEETTYLAQFGYDAPVHQGWGNHTRDAVYAQVSFVMSTDCQYTQQHPEDKLCQGCIHRMKPEVL